MLFNVCKVVKINDSKERKTIMNMSILQNKVVTDTPTSIYTEEMHRQETILPGYSVIRRNGSVVPFDVDKIRVALTKAFHAVRGQAVANSTSARQMIDDTVAQVVSTLTRRKQVATAFHIEEIQDQVELALLRGEAHDVGRAYLLYREARAQERQQMADEMLPTPIHVVGDDGASRLLDVPDLKERVKMAATGLDEVDCESLLRDVLREIYDGIGARELGRALSMAARARIEREPQYSELSARLLLDMLRTEVFGHTVSFAQMETGYGEHLVEMLKKGTDAGLINPQLLEKFDLIALGKELAPQRDLQFGYLGLQTLYDRYFLHIGGQRIELPQSFFMRVAMGLAINEDNPTARATEFYHLLSSFRFMSSTPTLFNSGTCHSQLSSCYLTTVPDALDGIFNAYKENALLAKFAGGLGNDWTPVRAQGSLIKGTNGNSQGVIPFLKIVNDTAVAVNQGGKRKGAVCAYLETWHLDILDFLDLRKNTGDERRRTHEINTANWVPDLFMKRVLQQADWTLFSPLEVPDLHDSFGATFEARYCAYEEMAAKGEILSKTIPAVDLWRRMLTMLYETGHPWITFKDTCNIRSPQQHIGVVHSSNLCTEITLNTNEEEIAVCNLGSVNLLAHFENGALNREMLSTTIRTAMRMLDNVIDINFYAVDKAKRSNQRHRPVGLGMMGFQDCLYEMGIAYNSPEAVEFADRSTEMVCYEAYWASTELAKERGAYETFSGSLWSRGILPQDSLRLLAKERCGQIAHLSGDLLPEGGDSIESDYLAVDLSYTLDWQALRERIRKYGMRNSNCVAIAPTATIANIIGVTASIEPTYQNVYAKSNLSGDFAVSNRYLVRDLKELALWDDTMLEDIKYFDGNLEQISRVPTAIRKKYPTAFEIAPEWLIECAARRQKWIDQAQSLNLYTATVSGKVLNDMYQLAWRRGLKTTYYLRTLAATSTEKYTSRAGAHNSVAVGETSHTVNQCAIDDPECEACQ